MYNLGISCYYHDSAAALLKDGVVVAAMLIILLFACVFRRVTIGKGHLLADHHRHDLHDLPPRAEADVVRLQFFCPLEVPHSGCDELRNPPQDLNPLGVSLDDAQPSVEHTNDRRFVALVLIEALQVPKCLPIEFGGRDVVGSRAVYDRRSGSRTRRGRKCDECRRLCRARRDQRRSVARPPRKGLLQMDS